MKPMGGQMKMIEKSTVSPVSNENGSSSNVTNSPIKMQPLRSVEEAVTDALRLAIHSGNLKPGQRLAQADLADQLGVSRIPLRDALRRLEAEALVKMDGRRGTWVSALSIEAVRENYEIRIMLEERCTHHAVKFMSDEEMTQMLVLFDAMDKAESEPDSNPAANGFAARREFYSQFYTYANRPIMRHQIMLLRDNVGRYHRFKDHDHSHHDHVEFRDALVKRDGAGAARVLKRHLEDARDDLIKDMKNKRAPAK
jgi:DNA-binding GntR family transcriptional regulator